jgi:hypothetical protein
VTPSRTHSFAVGLALFGSPGVATEGGAPQTAVAKLALTGEVFCRPSQPYFCSNMHVSCSGRTSIETFSFTLKANQSQGTIEPASGAESLAVQYADGRIEWDREGQYVILLPRLAGGYIKLLADGTYSFRHYAQDAGVMSIGRCS